MKVTVTKIDAAVHQLDWAIKLFIDHNEYLPAITLAGAAEEVLGELVGGEAAFRQLLSSLTEKYGVPANVVSQQHLNKVKNWLKHWKDLQDSEAIEADLEEEAIQYILRATGNLYTHDKSLTSETPRFFEWLAENRRDLFSG